MKQTNNAIKFLMAQYRAIFKNAYFKGMATAVLLTAGLAAGQAQAAATDFSGTDTQLPLLADPDQTITIVSDGTADGSNGKFDNFNLQQSGNISWNAEVVIESGSGEWNGNGNFLALPSGATAGATISGKGSLTINGGNDIASADEVGLKIGAYKENAEINISLGAINVLAGTLNVYDKSGESASEKSGSVTIAADTITVGDSAARDGSATAILNLTASAGNQDVKLTLGREANTDTGAVASEIIVNEGGVVLLDAGDDTKNSISVLGKSLAVNEGGLLVQTGSSGSNIINTDVLNVSGGQVDGCQQYL